MTDETFIDVDSAVFCLLIVASEVIVICQNMNVREREIVT